MAHPEQQTEEIYEEVKEKAAEFIEAAEEAPKTLEN